MDALTCASVTYAVERTEERLTMVVSCSEMLEERVTRDEVRAAMDELRFVIELDRAAMLLVKFEMFVAAFARLEL